jgi:hypothetical protein
MAATTTGPRALLGGFRRWRRSRPFWGGLLIVAAGVEILVAPAAQSVLIPLDLVVYAGIAGVAGYLIGFLLIAIGALAWLQPPQRAFYGIVAMLLSLASFMTSNFGGFVIGMLLGIVGAAMVFSWEPVRAARGRRRADADAEPGGPADADADGAADPADADAPPDADGPEAAGRLHAALALPLALTLLLPGAVPALGWPWDWFGGGDGEAADPGGGNGEDGQDGEDGAEDGGGEDEPESPDGAAGVCRFAAGDAAVAADEEEFRDAVLACEAARRDGDLPDVDVRDAETPWTAAVAESTLTADTLTMRGARFDGVVEYPTTDGPERYLRLSMDEAVLDQAELLAAEGEGRIGLGLPDLTMTGGVVLHVTRMQVRLPLIPIDLVFTPDFPPPLLLPTMVVTDLEVTQPLTQADRMEIGALDERVTP